MALKSCEGSRLKGLEISPDMIAIARRNAGEYGLKERAEYLLGSGAELPFGAGTFDAVFTAGSLHEWSEPTETLREAWRVLKAGGRLFVADLRRDMSPFMKWFMWLMVRPKSMYAGLLTSVSAAYTAQEARELLPAASCQVKTSPVGLQIFGEKVG